MKNKKYCFLLLVYVSFADKCPLPLQSIHVQCTGIQTKATFFSCCVLVWFFFFSIRKSSAKKRCSPWPMTSCKHVLRKLNSIWSEEEGPGCSLHPNNTQAGLFVLHMLRASQHSSSELPGSRCPAHIPWSQGCGLGSGTALGCCCFSAVLQKRWGNGAELLDPSQHRATAVAGFICGCGTDKGCIWQLLLFNSRALLVV